MFQFLISGALAEEAAEETAAESTKGLLESLAGNSLVFWIAFGTIIALGVITLVTSLSSHKWTTRTLTFGALSIALSFALSYIRLFRMPSGGSVTLASMLPLMLYAASFGIGPGLLAGLVYGFLQYLQGGWFLNFWQFSLDYLLAYAALGLTGLFRPLQKLDLFEKMSPNWWRAAGVVFFTGLLMEGYQALSGTSFAWGIFGGSVLVAVILTAAIDSTKNKELYLAMIIAVLVRTVAATLAGIVFWDTAPWASLVYNGTYLVPDTLICIVLGAAIAKPVLQVMKQQDRRAAGK